VARLLLVADTAEISRRRKLVSPARVVEAWPDLYAGGRFWMGESAKELLDGVGPPLPALLLLDGARVPIYYGPRLQEVESLPLEESLQARVLSAHGIAVVWITVDQFGTRTVYEPTGPTDPIFFLRRPGRSAAHRWRLFRKRSEAMAYMAEYYGRDSEGREWAETLPVESFDELLERHAVRANDAGATEVT
jgi:hypothetical protein